MQSACWHLSMDRLARKMGAMRQLNETKKEKRAEYFKIRGGDDVTPVSEREAKSHNGDKVVENNSSRSVCWQA